MPIPITRVKNKEQAKQYLNGMKNIKDKVVDITSDVISLPARLKSKNMIKQSNKDIAIIKKARLYKDVPDFDYKGNPQKEAINARINLDEVKRRLKNY